MYNTVDMVVAMCVKSKDGFPLMWL